MATPFLRKCPRLKRKLIVLVCILQFIVENIKALWHGRP